MATTLVAHRTVELAFTFPAVASTEEPQAKRKSS